MTREEAQRLLQAARPDGRDANDPALAEALALAQTDAGLKVWWEARQKFDRAVTAKLGEIAPPASLRERILAERKIVAFTPRTYLNNWLAAAAVVLLSALAYHLVFGVSGPMPSAHYEKSVLAKISDDKPALAMMSPDHDQVLAWLREHSSPTGSFPPPLAALPSVGCQTYAMHGHKVTLICFALNGGGLAHLFIVDKSALADPPADDFPSYSSPGDGWSMAAWSDNGKSFILATKAGPDTLKALL